MKTNTTLKWSAACVVIMFLYGGSAQATEQDGVSCPAGSTAERSNNNTTLKCRSGFWVLPSICPPLNHLGHIIIKPNNGVDKCGIVPLPLIPAEPDVNSAMSPPLPGMPPASEFIRDINGGNGNVDIFKSPKYLFPEGTFYNPSHNPAKGVSCPSGNTAYATEKGIRCVVVRPPRLAACPSSEVFEMNGGAGNEDRCKTSNNVIKTTVPVGMTREQLAQEKARGDTSWVLTIKPSIDEWVKRVYAYPNSRN
jgi:hypothetical protein